ncbi:MAG: hydroxymethylbilane synthase [Cyclobacteriaceae bacterium]|nr:hydroxymethylbilane synthase [Cyclobacteriaceae bacterium]
MKPVIRIATRTSPLALWQANAVCMQLQQVGNECRLVSITSTGDVDLVKPIYELGVQGVFTKELDTALLKNEADMAVHSLKDVPIVPAAGLSIAAVLKRASWKDVLLYKSTLPENKNNFTLATSSIRRKAQWLQRYPSHTLVNVRGNIGTRITKFLESDWDGMLMAEVALHRLDLSYVQAIPLDWMLPAPAQGAIGIVCRENDKHAKQILKNLNHETTYREVMAERQFLYALKGGCSAPISALVEITNDTLHFRGAVHSMDGSRDERVESEQHMDDWQLTGSEAAHKILNTENGSAILKEILQNRPGFQV